MQNLQSFKKAVLFIIIALSVYIITARLGTTCLFRLFTGICCPGCGMTRAWTSFLNGDIEKAFYYHPLFWLVIVVPAITLFKGKMNERLYNAIMLFFVALIMGCYFYRLFTGSPVVYINIQDSLIYKVYILLKNEFYSLK